MNTEQQPIAGMNQDAVNDMELAVAKTFSQMFALEVTGTSTALDANTLPDGDVTAVIEMGGKNPIATMHVIFPKDTIFKMLKRFYKKDFVEVDPKVLGAVGEIANVVYGVFKFRAADKGVQLGLALPKVVASSATPVMGAQWSFVGNYTSAEGPFQVCLTRNPL